MSNTDLVAMDVFLAEPRNAVVIGLRANGVPHGTPNWFLWQDGRFHVSTTRDRVKYRVFTRDSRVQLVIDEPRDFRYVVVDGTVEVIEDIDTALPHLQGLRAKHGRPFEDAAALRDEMERDGRVTLVITPSKPQSEWHARGF